MRSDAETVEAVLAGQREAFADLVRRHEGTVHAVAMSVLRNHHAAQDVCQDTFVAAYSKLATLRQPSSFGSWVAAMARNQALTFTRRKSPAQSLSDSPEMPAHQGGGRLDDRAERLLAAVMALPEHEQAVVTLRYFGGHSLEQIAEMTGQPVGTVGTQLHRARAHLRERLEEVRP